MSRKLTHAHVIEARARSLRGRGDDRRRGRERPTGVLDSEGHGGLEVATRDQAFHNVSDPGTGLLWHTHWHQDDHHQRTLYLQFDVRRVGYQHARRPGARRHVHALWSRERRRFLRCRHQLEREQRLRDRDPRSSHRTPQHGRVSGVRVDVQQPMEQPVHRVLRVPDRRGKQRFNFISGVRDNPSIPYVSGNEASGGWREGHPTASVGMVSPAPGKFDMYVRGLDNNVWMQRYSPAGWTPSSVTWTSIGGPAGGVIGRVSAVRRFNEQVDMFARQKTGMPTEEPTPVCTKARNGDSSWWPGPTTWACWSDFKTVVWPAATSTDANRLHVFAVGADGKVWEKSWTNTAGWLAPLDLGGNTKDPVTVVSRSQFRWDAFIRDASTGQICLKSRNGAALWPSQTQWFCMGAGSAIAGPPTAVTSGTNALDVVGVAQNGQVVRMWWRGGSWQGPMFLGGAFSSGGNVAATVAAVSRSPNQLDFFVSDLTNGGIMLKAFDGTTWWPNQAGAWASLGGDGIDVSAVSFASNRLDVVTRSRLDKAVRHRHWQDIWW